MKKIILFLSLMINITIISFSETTNFQLGLINITDQINGVQVGFLNFAKNGILPVMPFLNFNWRL